MTSSQPPVVLLQGRYFSSCGYCQHHEPLPYQSEEDRPSYGLQACQPLQADIYDRMIQRNWRRCGFLYYYPYPNQSTERRVCCPQMAIRLSVPKFKMHRKQAALLRKCFRLLNGDPAASETNCSRERGGRQSADTVMTEAKTESVQQTFKIKNDQDEDLGVLTVLFRDLLKEDAPSWPLELQQQWYFDAAALLQWKPWKSHKSPEKQGWSTAIVLKLAGLLQNKYKQPLPFDSAHGYAQHLGDKLRQLLAVDGSVGLEITSHGHFNFFKLNPEIRMKSPVQAIKSVTQGEDTARSGEASSSTTADTKKGGEVLPVMHQQLRMTFNSSAIVREDEFDLYKQYQMLVHHDDEDEISPRSYNRFLCKSSLITEEYQPISFLVHPTAEGRSIVFEADQKAVKQLPLGSHHIRYEVKSPKGQWHLIAVSVVDLLPTGLSSVYCFYDPSTQWKPWSLGTLTALIEISWLRSHRDDERPDCLFYYLGYYIHACKKMKYKMQFQPCEVLCPHSFQWMPMNESLVKKLDEVERSRKAIQPFREGSATGEDDSLLNNMEWVQAMWPFCKLLLVSQTNTGQPSYQLRLAGNTEVKAKARSDILEGLQLLGAKLGRDLIYWVPMEDIQRI